MVPPSAVDVIGNCVYGRNPWAAIFDSVTQLRRSHNNGIAQRSTLLLIQRLSMTPRRRNRLRTAGTGRLAPVANLSRFTCYGDNGATAVTDNRFLKELGEPKSHSRYAPRPLDR